MTKKKTFQTLDLYLSAFLSLHGFEPLLVDLNGRVVFVFEACDNLYKLMAKYNSNSEICVIDYVTRIKMLRSKLLSMRGKNEGGG